MKLKAKLLDEKALKRTITRISHEIIEKNKGVDNIVLVGVKRRGIPIAKRIQKCIFEIEGIKVPIGNVDISFYRDDLTMLHEQPVVSDNEIELDVKDKKVIIVDDVLYTGRTARAAIEAVIEKGRPSMIELAVIVDRGHRELPIRADFVGKNIPTSKEEMIAVELTEIDGLDGIEIYDL